MVDDEQTAEPTQIGALAKATGLTVRALHHYDAIGLLVPDERSCSGRRLYSEENVQRLYRIVALRQLGLSLEQIAAALQDGPDLLDLMREHLVRLEQSVELQRRLHSRLGRMVELLEREREPTVDAFLQAIEETTMIENYYTPEQLDELAQRREEMGPEAIAQAEREWADLIDAVGVERAAGTEPDSPRMLELARRWRGLTQQFTGGNEGIRRSLHTMYREEGAQAASRAMIDEELMQYVGRALAAL